MQTWKVLSVPASSLIAASVEVLLMDVLRQVLCFYFVFTVFVTVGFGDITAGNSSERVLLLLLLLS
jgi:hypothetical protein